MSPPTLEGDLFIASSSAAVNAQGGSGQFPSFNTMLPRLVYITRIYLPVSVLGQVGAGSSPPTEASVQIVLSIRGRPVAMWDLDLSLSPAGISGNKGIANTVITEDLINPIRFDPAAEGVFSYTYNFNTPPTSGNVSVGLAQTIAGTVITNSTLNPGSLHYTTDP